MKLAGTVILILGLGVSALYGARNPETLEARAKLEGERAVLEAHRAALDAQRDAYDLRLLGGGEPIQAQLARRAALEEVVAGRDAGSRVLAHVWERAWLRALTAHVDAGRALAEAATGGGEAGAQEAQRRLAGEQREAARQLLGQIALVETPTPGARFVEWFERSGVFFGFGLLLMAMGGVMVRVALRREARDDDQPGGRAEAVDMGALLEQLSGEVAALGAEMQGNDAPVRADFVRVIEAVETLQLEKIERLVEARFDLQRRYGLAAYAEVFSPLSSGERKVNRAWSALVDGHWPEASSAVADAAQDFAHTRRVMGEVAARGAA